MTHGSTYLCGFELEMGGGGAAAATTEATFMITLFPLRFSFHWPTLLCDQIF